MRKISDHSRWAVAWLVTFVLLTACSKEKLDEMVNKAKEQAAAMSTTPVMAEIIPVTGRGEVRLSPPVESKVGYARLYVIGDGRPNVLQLTTYDPEKGPNQFPALLIRATTTATSAESASGQMVNGRVFLQATSGAAILYTPPTAPVDITLATVDAKKGTLDATVGPIALLDATGKTTQTGGIILEGVLP